MILSEVVKLLCYFLKLYSDNVQNTYKMRETAARNVSFKALQTDFSSCIFPITRHFALKTRQMPSQEYNPPSTL